MAEEEKPTPEVLPQQEDEAEHKEHEPAATTTAEPAPEEKEESGGLMEQVMAEVNRFSPPKEIPNEEPPTTTKEESATLPAEETESEAVPVEEVTKEEAPTEETEEKEKEKQKENELEEMVVPHLLSDEEIIERGVSEADIGSYRRFYLRQAFSPKKWYESVKEHSFETTFLSLSPEEVDALLASCHLPSEEEPTLSDEQKQVLDQLKEKIDTAINDFGDSGAFVKLNTRSPADAILEKNNGEYIQTIQEGILNEMEIESQFANAYLIWRSWRSSSFRESEPRSRGDNVLRRSMRRIQKTFRPTSSSGGGRARSKSEDGSAPPLAEDAAKDENKEEASPPAEEATPTDAATDDAAASTTAPITVQATVETTTAAEGEVATTETETQAAETEPQTAETETQATETETPATETETQATETETQAAETETPATETETQATETETQATETETQAAETETAAELTVEATAGDDSGQKDQSPDATAPKSKPRSVLKKTQSSEEHQILKVKRETLQNKVLRAYTRTMCARNKVSNGTEAIFLLTTSSVVKEELQQIQKFRDIAGTDAVLSVMKWSATELARYPGMNFRGFVYKNKLTALTQLDDIMYVPNIVRFKPTIQKKIEYFFDTVMKSSLETEQNYVMDIFVAPNKMFVTELHPFHQSTGACLFTWQQSQKLLMNGPLEFCHVHTPFKSCFTGLLPHWQSVCETVTQQKRETERATPGKCSIL